MKRQLDSLAEPLSGRGSKEHKLAQQTQSVVKQRRAVPPGYLHDLLHTRHLMKSVGLRGPIHQQSANKNVQPSAAVTSGRIAALVKPQQPCSKAAGTIPAITLPSLFEHRKRFLQTKKRKERGRTPYQQHPGKPVGLLSLPEDVLVSALWPFLHRPAFSSCSKAGACMILAMLISMAFSSFYAAEDCVQPVARRHQAAVQGVQAIRHHGKAPHLSSHPLLQTFSNALPTSIIQSAYFPHSGAFRSCVRPFASTSTTPRPIGPSPTTARLASGGRSASGR